MGFVVSDFVGAVDVTGVGVSCHIEEAAASGGVHPSFIMDIFGIFTHKEVIRPFLIGQLSWVVRSGDMRFTVIGKFGLFALAAPGAMYEQHVGWFWGWVKMADSLETAWCIISKLPKNKGKKGMFGGWIVVWGGGGGVGTM